ncbi:MAG: enoyl-CoA hydratase/isomerase family protein [Alphaproteobacteria bacterium]|nr:MAG: enoyl-CoA hydratase/isomerase family protein [Alphaproteobacteria bacterium]
MGEMLELTVAEGGVADLVLNRPQVHNAFNDELIARLGDAFAELDADEAVRAVLVRARGRNFCAGADLDWMRAAASYGEEENRLDAERLSEMLHRFNAMRKPTLVLVQGAAIGGGAGLVACADIAVAVRNARFGFSEVRLGLTPATISPYVIAKIGESAARRWFLTGERFDAETAHAIGLVHDLVGSEGDLLSAAERILGDLLKAPPGALAVTKDLIARVKSRPIDPALRAETAAIIAERRASEEAREGIAAFFERRLARWVRRPSKGDNEQG